MDYSKVQNMRLDEFFDSLDEADQTCLILALIQRQKRFPLFGYWKKPKDGWPVGCGQEFLTSFDVSHWTVN